MSNVVYIEEESGKKRLMNNEKLYVKILTKFTAETTLEGLDTHLEARDWAKIQAVVHAVKGVAANLSLLELHKQCMDVEHQVKEETLELVSLEGLKACLAETIVHVEKVIEKYA